MALLKWPNRIIIFGLISLAQAYTVFETNCSVPVTQSNYVSSPNSRGTLDILWSSLFTIFACTWSIQHPNLPEQEKVDDRDSTLKGWRAWAYPAWRTIKWKVKGFYRSTIRMLWTAIAPELIVVAACSERFGAQSICESMKELDLGEDEKWSLTHSYYANMGGFVVRNPSADKTIYHDPYHLTGEDLVELRKGNHIAKLPDITEAEIKDRSKSDMLGKSIALGQIAWSIIQIIARAVRKLPVSPLEVAVVAFAVCAILSYILYWEKPQRVSVTHTISLQNSEKLYNKARPEESTRLFKALFNEVLEHFGFSIKNSQLYGAPISMDMDQREFGSGEAMVIFGLVSVSAALFGGVHAIAWNFAFPSTVERIFWRCASIYTASAPACAILILLINGMFDLTEQKWTHYLTAFFIILSTGLSVLYTFARLFIIVEMFRTLYYLPPGSFVSTWASNVPHIA
jgi:hypothetical protein